MRFLLDADLPRSLVPLLARFGHEGLDVRDLGMGVSSDPDIAKYARDHQLCLISGDWGFADIRANPPILYAGIVIIGLPDGAPGAQILELAQLLLHQPEILALLPGRLAIVEKGRIRLRPPA